MKTEAKHVRIRCGQQGGEIVLADDADNSLSICRVDPAIIASLVILSETNADGRDSPAPIEMNLTLPMILKQLIPKGKLREVYLNRLDPETQHFSAELDWDGTKMTVTPSAGILLAKIADAPIYFDTDIKPDEDEEEEE